MKDISIIIGRNIRQFRELKGWTLEELAERSGYDVSTKKSSMSKIENGKNDIPTSRLYAIATALGVEVTDLIRDGAGMEARMQQTCDLLAECHDQKVYQIVQMVLRLDDYDRGRIHGQIENMLDAEKYKQDAVSRHA